MFYRLDADIASRSDLTLVDKAVFAVIQTRIGKNEFCWCGSRRVGKGLALDKDTVHRAIKRLEAMGLLKVERRGNGQSAHYSIPVTVPTEQTVKGTQLDTPTVPTAPIDRPQAMGTEYNIKEHLDDSAPLHPSSAAPQKNRKPSLRKKSKGKKKAPPDSRVKPLLNYFRVRFFAVKKKKYLPAFARDLAILKKLLADIDGDETVDDTVVEIERAIDAMFADKWGKAHADIPLLRRGINSWRTVKGFTAAPGADYKQYDDLGVKYND